MALLNIVMFSAVISIEILRIEGINQMTSTESPEEFFRAHPLFSSGSPCAENTECFDSEKCVDNSCTHACLNECTDQHELCFGRNHTYVCFCAPGYAYNSANACEHPCTDASDCNPLEDCYKDERITGRCECKHMYIRDKYNMRQCQLSRICHDDNACQSFERCVRGTCIDVCSKHKCVGPFSGCLAHNHSASCVCADGYAISPNDKCEKIECAVDRDCGNNEVCVVTKQFPHCDCELAYARDYTDRGTCRLTCVYEIHCPARFWCNGEGMCVPCDGRMCS